MRIFVSSTFADLAEHRTAVNDVLQRMRLDFSAMEYFGSRADEVAPACMGEIRECTVFVGIYAWRYGWQPSPDTASITEQEFDHARLMGKRCLCYVVDEKYPWPPGFVDQGDLAARLRHLKQKVGVLVRSRFTTPDDLAKQVAADLARELIVPSRLGSFGSLLDLNWDVFSPELQTILSTAYSQALRDSDDGVVATRHVIAALAGVPSTARALVLVFRNVKLPRLRDGLSVPAVHELFQYDKPVSSCVLASMSRLLPDHSPSQRLIALELAVDLLKYGTGDSVASFRRAGVGADAVDRALRQIRQVASDAVTLQSALDSLDDSELHQLAYASGASLGTLGVGLDLRKTLLAEAAEPNRSLLLVGELMRRHPEFLVID